VPALEGDYDPPGPSWHSLAGCHWQRNFLFRPNGFDLNAARTSGSTVTVY
jgi:hypothetical protein